MISSLSMPVIMQNAYLQVNTKRIGLASKLCDMTSLCDRLKLARKKAGYSKAAEAAHSMGIPTPTYYAHENGSRMPKMPELQRYAKKFKVSAEWLASGKQHGVSEASLSEAIELIFNVVQASDLSKMESKDIAALTLAVAKAVEQGGDKSAVIGNVVEMLTESMKRAS